MILEPDAPSSPSPAPDRPSPSPRPQAPPMPARWQRPRPARQRHLTGAGLGLYALRPIPLIGRHDERTQLWEELRRARQEHQPRCVILRGPSGVGKSRLVEWIAERADELGAATSMSARHGPISGPLDGLGGALARALRGADQTAAQLHARLLERADLRDPLARYDVQTLAHMAASAQAPAEPGERARRPSRAQDRHAALGRWLTAARRLAR